MEIIFKSFDTIGAVIIRNPNSSTIYTGGSIERLAPIIANEFEREKPDTG